MRIVRWKFYQKLSMNREGAKVNYLLFWMTFAMALQSMWHYAWEMVAFGIETIAVLLVAVAMDASAAAVDYSWRQSLDSHKSAQWRNGLDAVAEHENELQSIAVDFVGSIFTLYSRFYFTKISFRWPLRLLSLIYSHSGRSRFRFSQFQTMKVGQVFNFTKMTRNTEKYTK